MRPFAIAVLLLVSAALCSGCHFSWPRVANVPIQQGNVITQEMVDKLKPGMTRRQIAFVMGEPVMRNPFNPDRWDYVYSVQVGSVVYQQLRMSLFFENDMLAKFTGDMAPTTAAQNKEADTVADPLLEGPREDQITAPAG